jgi:hypothetical protein
MTLQEVFSTGRTGCDIMPQFRRGMTGVTEIYFVPEREQPLLHLLV